MSILRPLAMGIVVMAAASADATDVFYPDQTVYSPNRKFRLEARSPDNAKANDGRSVPFADDFTYRLFDEASGRELWAHRQGKENGSPGGIFINDDRWIVVCGAWGDIQVLDPDTGVLVLTFRLLDQFPADERKKYVHDTTAGPEWAGCSIWRFAQIEGKVYFEIRAWWDRRVVIDLAKARVVPDEDAIRTALDRADRDFVIETLRVAADSKPPREDGSEGYIRSDILAATLMAGRLKIKETIPFLRKLETWQVVGSTVGGRSRPGDWPKGTIGGWPKGSIDPLGRQEFKYRQMVQLALRRLGERPAGYAATRFWLVEKRAEELVPVKSPFPGRVQGCKKVVAGMSPKEVLNLVGAPDLIPRRRIEEPRLNWLDFWDYDIDTDAPYTLRISWTDEGRVEKVETIKQPVWSDGNTRDQDVVR